MKLTRKQKNQIERLKNRTPEEISRELGLELPRVVNYLESIGYLGRNREVGGGGEKLPPGTFQKLILNFVSGNWYKILLIVLLTLAVYSSSLGNEAVSDDKPLFLALKSGSYITEATREPVNALFTVATYLFNYSLSGANTWSYHLVNVVLHILAALLIFFFLSLITNSRVSFLAALIFAVNPLHSESVDWLSGRHYILYSIFVMAALAFYHYFTQVKKETKYYLISIGLFIAAVYSFPEQAVVFPLLLPLLDFLKGNIKKNWKYYLIFFILAGLFSWLSLNRVQSRIAEVGADALVSKGKGLEFLIGDAAAIYSYLKLYIFPFGLSFYHETISASKPVLLLYGLVTLSFLLLLPLIFYKRNRLVVFAVGLFLITLLPTLTPLKVSWVVAERYAYLAALGPALLTALAADHLLRNLKLRQMATISLIILISFWSLSTFVRGFDWKDEDSLWVATAKTSPDSSKAWNNMGDYYGRHGDIQASFDAFVKATKINPTYADAWHNAGNTLTLMGKLDESIPYFEKSLKFNPKLIEAYNNLAMVYQKKADGQKAYEMINRSLQINPNAAKTYAILAYIEYENKNMEKAKEALKRGLALEPQNEAIRKNLTLLENRVPVN